MGVARRARLAWRVLTMPEREWPQISLDEWASYFGLGNFVANTSYGYTPQEEPESSFAGLARGAMKANGVIFACMIVRQFIFNQARYRWQAMRNGQPGPLFGTPELARLEEPWVNGTTADLNNRAIQDADLAGNSYFVRRPVGLRRLPPDWVRLLIGVPNGADSQSPWDPDAEIVGYAYYPGGPASGQKPKVYLPELIAHWAPIPDPDFRFRGMSWMTPVIREIMADNAATAHKLKFFENAATPNMVVRLDVSNPDLFDTWVAKIEGQHTGTANAYRTLYLGAGQDATVVGSNLQQMDFKITQGAGETRIAAAAGIHPVIVGLSEGLQGSALNAGNFNSARRLTADKTFHSLWQGFAGVLQSILTRPPSAELTYDPARIPFLEADQTDKAQVQQVNSIAIKTLTDAGFKPDTAVDAVMTGDYSRLVHTGLYSVQLQPPQTQPSLKVLPGGQQPQLGAGG